ncbi:MAG: hypothetical protein OEW19_08885 [Acidobacteriota bacterium]|nr:hypothetical protein [Acidobacteriota bacterium]
MRRLIVCSTLLALALVPLAAQSTSGWKIRADRSTSASDPDGAGEIKFMAMGKGFHAVNPAAAVYWHPSNTATGAYTVKGTFTLNKPSSHNNYYGIVFGGSGLEGADQNYLYFLIGQDGSFLIKRRIGDAKTDNVVAKTPHAAIKKPDASGKSTNVLEVRVASDKVDFVVNGTSVQSMPKADLKTDGIWGIRVNHQLDVTIEDIGVTK